MVGASDLLQQLQEILRAHPAGLSEYDLIQSLEARQIQEFAKQRRKDNLSLFQTHFLLFNALYQLSDQLAAEGKDRLIIHTLCIQLLPVMEVSSQALGEPDEMREYYLDLQNLHATDAEDVDALLHQFWQRFLRNDERREALAVLELEEPVEWDEIKQRHRQLAMQHHPDRGGDEKQLQLINAAMTTLTRSRTKSQR